MESSVLRRLDDMFQDLREELRLQHLQKVHQPKIEPHSDSCSFSDGKHQANRRHSYSGAQGNRRDSVARMANESSAVRRGSLPFGGQHISQNGQPGRRSSLPVVTQVTRRDLQPSSGLSKRRDSTGSEGSSRRDSTGSRDGGSNRKFSRDSIDLDVIEDVGELELDDSIIFEEDETQEEFEVPVRADDQLIRWKFPLVCRLLLYSFIRDEQVSGIVPEIPRGLRDSRCIRFGATPGAQSFNYSAVRCAGRHLAGNCGTC
jgi:hypothetical protein